MGYFKSIEQFLFSYISLHTIEKDSVNRKIFAGAKPLDTLSDKLLNDSSKVKNINLKSITSFLEILTVRNSIHVIWIYLLMVLMTKRIIILLSHCQLL